MNPSNRDKGIYYNQDPNNCHNKPMYERNPVGCDGIPLQCHTCCSIAHFASDCTHQKENLKDNPDKKNAAYLYAVSNVAECDASDSYAYHAFNHMILDNGCQQNVAGNTWANNFIETLD